MEYSTIYLFVAVGVILSGNTWAFDSCEDAATEVFCSDDATTIIFCYQKRNEWIEDVRATCPFPLSCDEVDVVGCKYNEDLTTTTTVATTCVSGTLQQDDSSCRAYFYCAGGTWHSSECPLNTGYDDSFKQCRINCACC